MIFYYQKMYSKGDIIREIDKIKIQYQSGEYRVFANFDILITNFDKLIDFYNKNDLWEDTTFGANESMPYTCLYILTVSCTSYKSIEELTNCEKFYSFVKKWFIENYEKYVNKEDVWFQMILVCSEEVSDSLKKEK